jgi:nucleoprotein TPR
MARSRLESEIEQFRSTTTNEASETAALQSRISSLEAASRDTVALLDSKSIAYDKLGEDLAAQHQKTVELRRHAASLEQRLQAANSAAASTKFKESSLVQELDLLKRNNEWLEAELRTKADEHIKYRKDKSERISELQRLNEQKISEADTLRLSEASLRSRLDDQVQKNEDLLAELQQLKEDRIQDAESFRVELDSAARLAELQKASADTAKQRANELSAALEEAKDDAAEELGRMRAEAETEHAERDVAEARRVELENTVQRLESELDTARAQPGTPQRGVNGQANATPNRSGTPTGFFSPPSGSRLKGNLSITQMYANYNKLERDLANERRTNEHLSASLEEMVKDLELSKPEIEELRNDHAKLQAETLEMSKLMDNAKHDRDAAVKEARRLQGELESATKEIQIYQQQVRDLSSEVKTLLTEQHIREKGRNLSQEDLAELQEAARPDISGLSDTGRVISEQLTMFRSWDELLEQNTKMRSMLRQLGERLESDEAREKQQLHQQEQEELITLRARVFSYQDELQSMVAQSQSYIKERDMFRNMLTRRGHLPGQLDPNDFARSMPLPAAGSPARGLVDSIQGGSVPGDESDFAKLLKDLQLHFDSYRREAATDHSALKNQVNELSKKNSHLQTEASRAHSQLAAANQRGDMLQANFNMLKAENAEIQKRAYASMENATRQELKTQQTAEELVELRGFLESARREAANLKAEKELAKSVQNRLVEDNESLRNERARLDQLNATLQNLLNEREQSDAETHRRLQITAETLETELQVTKRKLNDELEESKKANLRREYEQSQNQKRIDDLLASLSSVR